MLKFMLIPISGIFTIKNKPVHVRERFNLNSGRMYKFCNIDGAYLWGRKSQMPERNLAVIEGFVSRLVVLDYDSAAAMTPGKFRAELARREAPVGPLTR